MDNCCYIVGCENTRKALVIDPDAYVERILSVAEKEGLDCAINFWHIYKAENNRLDIR